MVGEAYRVLIRPVLTEKSAALAQKGKYTFEVLREANKIQVKKAVQEIFSVQVTGVNIMNVRGKPRRRTWRAGLGKTRSWKKAIVSLVPGQRISIFEATK